MTEHAAVAFIEADSAPNQSTNRMPTLRD